jgi:tetratricopeptide (TPR) repeat protein
MNLRLRQCHLIPILICAAAAFAQQAADPLASARALLTAGKLAESETVLRTQLITSPSSAEAHFLLGYVLFREQKAKDSLAEFTAGAQFQRPRAGDLKVVASDYVILGDYTDADKWFSAVVAETPDDADAWYLLGRTRYNENDFAAGVSNLEHALTLRPKFVEAENNLGLCLKELGYAEKAQAAFQSAIEWQGSTPEDPQPFLNLGTLLASQHHTEPAISLLTEAARLSPSNPKIHEALGDVYGAQQDLPKAQSEFEKAISLAQDIAALHFKLGQVYRKEGQLESAQHEFAICAKLNGTHSSEETPNPLKRP